MGEQLSFPRLMQVIESGSLVPEIMPGTVARELLFAR
jgi:hypothetical protein